jgi:hypothetical protein
MTSEYMDTGYDPRWVSILELTANGTLAQRQFWAWFLFFSRLKSGIGEIPVIARKAALA